MFYWFKTLIQNSFFVIIVTGVCISSILHGLWTQFNQTFQKQNYSFYNICINAAKIQHGPNIVIHVYLAISSYYTFRNRLTLDRHLRISKIVFYNKQCNWRLLKSPHIFRDSLKSQSSMISITYKVNNLWIYGMLQSNH